LPIISAEKHSGGKRYKKITDLTKSIK